MMTGIDPEWLHLASAPAALATMMLVQALAMRFRRGGGPYHSLAAGFVTGLVVLVVLQAWLLTAFPDVPDRWVLALAVNPTIFLFLAYGFFNFINVGFVSIRIRIFEECRARGGFVSRSELGTAYDDQLVKIARLERLMRQGHIATDGNRWRLVDRRYVPVARVVFGLKKFVLRRDSEFGRPR
jgi:hypothetical protein